ncbi:MAG: hypothetical protein A2X36_16560 [Elusimicrobia bacterium GWA2_69_24]|nr:MAG: hypothetical protein A2X36_16560 [Elusimicrobia bacterium GWA2_69_24]HBL16348.1 hypothetical protein [Elusimicrobiota bacterium]
MSDSETRSIWTGRALAACVLAALAGAAWLDRSSAPAKILRRMDSMTALVSMRFQGQAGVLPPTLYLAVYSPATHSLELAVIPPQTPRPQQPQEKAPRTLADTYGAVYARQEDSGAAAEAMSRDALALLAQDPLWPRDGGGRPDFWLELEVPAEVRPAFPQELRSWLAPLLAKPLFLIDFVRAAGRDAGAVRWTDPPHLYDLLLIGRELGRLSVRDIRLAQFPSSRRLLHPFLGGVFSRARGMPEGPAALTIEVLNASDQPGIALRATKLLRLQGLDVLHFGNAAGGEARTRFLDRTGRNGAARSVAAALGCPEEEVLSALEENTQVSVTAVIGRDHGRCTRLREGAQ